MKAERFLETRKASKLREILALFGLVAVFLALWYCWFLSPRWRHFAASRTPSSQSVSTAFEDWHTFSEPPQIYAQDGSGRAVFPYSVIPGGARSSGELAQAVQHDPQVAQHYSDFLLRKAHVIRLKKDRQAYVSYRLGDRIYWTRHKVTLHAGETLLTDGRNMARGRCGNRVSDSPKLPVSPKEPEERTMSQPVFVPDPWPLGFPEFRLEPITLAPQSFGPPPSVPPGGPFPPFFPPIFPGGPGTPPTPPGPPPPPPPLVSTPEPASGLLVLLGLACLGALGALLRK